VLGQIRSAPSELRAVAVQPDGKLVAAGADRLALIRLNPDGTYDQAFGTDGVVTLKTGIANEASGLVLQPDGKIVVNGFAYVPGLRFTLTRFTPAGRPDESFAPGGMVTTAADSTGITGTKGYVCPSATCIRPIVLQPDGRYVAAGYAEVGGMDVLTLLRYEPSVAAASVDPGPTPPPQSPPAQPLPAAPAGGTPVTAQPAGPETVLDTYPAEDTAGPRGTLPRTGLTSLDLAFAATVLMLSGLVLTVCGRSGGRDRSG
jgi:uncharacterized delta-60 repeat protein